MTPQNTNKKNPCVKYPTDIIGYFIGDITLMDNYIQLYKENLGIYKVKVYCPKDIKHPLLPVRYKNNIIYPLCKK